MPSGKNHDKITWLCLPFILGISIIITRELDLTFLLTMGFIFSGLMFGPDLDIYSIQYQRWGFLQFIWLPYQKSLKHRSFFSHGFVIGTIIRVFYLTFILLIVAFLLVAMAKIIFGFSWQWQKFIINSYEAIKNQYWQEILSLLIGLELGAMSHYIADNIDSRLKSRNKKKSSQSKQVVSRRRKTFNKNRKKVNHK
ncbi:MAG: metal-binding protein [Cyanobacteria bacterium]|nr:metal-binding protein [Cyanobacteria bacterium CG_2015-16_32_12]NCO79165.1 metal-binding protein [Cyanobacteria bacterium CG_2015-22_32_23]NCQ04882.1 metal-binding protein [Cyanobacteria bacterium CG_2015-09_32_10]NCQ41245.1 metal-binding protein [Cyanobacteria bacterium CG_2015-04_32_10]NCS84994.1 metal-binding protein [Cyanobacteria bacterium CG_2015-02_32_10]